MGTGVTFALWLRTHVLCPFSIIRRVREGPSLLLSAVAQLYVDSGMMCWERDNYNTTESGDNV